MNKKQEIDTDRISSLPDELLVQILSLVSLKEAVSTSLLATSWRNLWAQVPNLVIKEKWFSTRSHFIDFVGRAMAMRGQTSIGVFSLECVVEQDAPVITNWIEMAVRCNVRHLYLYLWNDGSPYLLPPSIFESEMLEIFQLNSSCVLVIPSPKPLPKLKVLSLNKVMFVDDDSVTRLFAGPSLLAITLKRCKWRNLHRIHISPPKLQYLSINDYVDRSKNADNSPYKDIFSYDRRIEINGASLGTFRYKGEGVNEYKLSGVNRRLVEADIHVNCDYPVNLNIVVPRVCQLLSDVSKVRNLTVSPALLEDLAREGNGGDLQSLPDFSLLEELFIDGPIDSFGFLGLCMILRRSNRLFRLGLWDFKQKPGNPDLGWLADPIPTCFLTCLKEITVQCLHDQVKELVERDIFILRQLVKSMIALEYMEIHYRTEVINTKALKRRLAKFPVGSKGMKCSLFGSYFIFCPTTKIPLGTGHVKDDFHIGKEESSLSRCRS